jgi:hypothetical protein
MQAEVEHQLWNDYVQRDDQLRLQRPVEPDFGSGQCQKLILGMPNIEQVKAVSRKDLPRYVFRVYSNTSAGDKSKAGFVAHALSARVTDKYRPGASRHLRLEDVTQSDMRDMLRDHLGWKKKTAHLKAISSLSPIPHYLLSSWHYKKLFE